MRRFATVDWALLGYAAGAGFVVAEDGIRRLQRPGLLDMFLGGDAGLPQSFDPLTSGMFTSPDGLVLAAGHQVWTASIAMGIGLGLALWRSKGLRMGRLWAWAPPLATLAMAVSDHAAYNAYVSPSNWPATGGEGFPGWMWFVWTLGFKGRAVFVVAVVLFIACLLVDAHRRVAAGRYGVTVPDAPGIGSPALASWPRFVRVPAQAACAFLSAAWSDVAVVWAAHAARGGNRAKAMLAGREAGLLVRRTRADAMLATAGGTEPRSRTLFRIGALLLGAAGIGACLAYGVLVARDIGRLLAVSGDHPYFAGLLDMLATWWDGLGPGGQVLAIALGVGLVVASGGSLALALGATGIGAWVAGHGHGLADLVRNPQEAVRRYLAEATPGQFLWDTADFLLTFVPGSLLGKLGGTAARQLASELRAAQLWKRAPVEAITTLDDMFRQREAVVAARDAAIRNLEDLMPPGYTLKDFSKTNWVQTSQDLKLEGLNASQVQDLGDAAVALQRARSDLTRMGTRIGEFGGERLLTLDGYRIPDAFASSQGTPGGKLLDGFAIKDTPSGTTISVPEFKGVTARLDTTPRPTAFEGLASQGTPAYVRDRLVTDPRVADFFAGNPDLWTKAKNGEIAWDIKVISTRGPESVTMTEQPFTLTTEIIEALQASIDARLAAR